MGIVRGDISDDEVDDNTRTERYVESGLTRFDFGNETESSHRGKKTRVNMAHLLFHIWPGDWRQQIITANRRIQADHEAKRGARGGGSRVRVIKDITKHEFAVFLAIMLIARLEDKKGDNLWDSSADEGDGEGYNTSVNLSSHMTKTRFKEIKIYMPYLFSDPSKEGINPWWQVTGGIEALNKTRQMRILSSL